MSIHAFEMLDVSGAGALKCERTKEKVCREANERERKDLTYEQSKLKTFRGEKGNDRYVPTRPHMPPLRGHQREGHRQSRSPNVVGMFNQRLTQGFN